MNIFQKKYNRQLGVHSKNAHRIIIYLTFPLFGDTNYIVNILLYHNTFNYCNLFQIPLPEK